MSSARSQHDAPQTHVPRPPPGACELTSAGHTLHLLPEKALWWPATRTLLFADVHLGKASSFAAQGVPLSDRAVDATTSADIQRINHLVAAHTAQRVIVLGDLLHDAAGRVEPVLAALRGLGARLAGQTSLVLVRGNHDQRAGDPPVDAGFTCVDEPYVDPLEPGFTYRHHPPLHPPEQHGGENARNLTLCGHVHPAVTLVDPTGRRERCPCFWLSQGVLVLPAFGSFTGCKAIHARAGDGVFAVGPGAVVRVR